MKEVYVVRTKGDTVVTVIRKPINKWIVNSVVESGRE